MTLFFLKHIWPSQHKRSTAYTWKMKMHTWDLGVSSFSLQFENELLSTIHITEKEKLIKKFQSCLKLFGHFCRLRMY